MRLFDVFVIPGCDPESSFPFSPVDLSAKADDNNVIRQP
jgi:hypothetical protein